MAQSYTVEDIVRAAEVVIQGNLAAVQRGDVSVEAGSGARAGVISMLLLLGLEVQFADGTTWKHRNDGSVEERRTGDEPYDPQKPPEKGRERLN